MHVHSFAFFAVHKSQHNKKAEEESDSYLLYLVYGTRSTFRLLKTETNKKKIKFLGLELDLNI